MIQRVVIFTEYWFYPGVKGTDHLEGNQWSIDKVLGKGVVEFHNKKGGILRLMFIGEPKLVEKAKILMQVEETCHLVFCGQKEAQYKPEWERNLRDRYGDKLIVK